jgi:hypothetical protein
MPLARGAVKCPRKIERTPLGGGRDHSTHMARLSIAYDWLNGSGLGSFVGDWRSGSGLPGAKGVSRCANDHQASGDRQFSRRCSAYRRGLWAIARYGPIFRSQWLHLQLLLTEQECSTKNYTGP